jgi:hypothetical protein
MFDDVGISPILFFTLVQVLFVLFTISLTSLTSLSRQVAQPVLLVLLQERGARADGFGGTVDTDTVTTESRATYDTLLTDCPCHTSYTLTLYCTVLPVEKPSHSPTKQQGLSVRQSGSPTVCLSDCLFVCQTIWLSGCLAVYLKGFRLHCLLYFI